jgi:tetratricopeptide (TPR) repeat protein
VKTYAERARSAAPADEVGLLELWIAAAENSMGEHEAATQSAQRALAALPVGAATWCDAAVQLSEALQTLGDRPGLARVADLLLSGGGERADRAAFAVACARVVIDLRRCGVNEPVARMLNAIEEHEADVDETDTRRRAFLHRHRAMEALYRDDHERALHELEASVRAFDAVGDDLWAARQRFNLGFFLSLLGKAPEGEAVLRASSKTVQRLDLSHLKSVHGQNLGFALLQQGKLDEAEAMYSASAQLSTSAGALRAGGFAHLYLGLIALARGDLERAEREAQAALDAFRQSVPAIVPFARALLARVALARGELDRALSEAVAARSDLSGSLRLGEGEAYVRLTHAEVLHALGRLDEARASIHEGATRLRERANRLRSAELHDAFLEQVFEHRRTLALAEEWGT